MPVLHVFAARPDARAVADPRLTEAERARCATYRHEIDAARHATGRLLARAALRHLAGVDTALIVDAMGRPRPMGAPGLDVSISHAGDIVLVAAARATVGVDVEQVATVASLLATPGGPASGFTAAERAMLDPARATVPGSPVHVSIAARATSWWVAKEAVLKGAGVGLSVHPDTIDARCELIEVVGHGRWRVTDLAPHLPELGPDSCAAAAVPADAGPTTVVAHALTDARSIP